MDKQEGEEKRKAPRVRREIIVQYREKERPYLVDITSTKDVSETGASFTVSRFIAPEAILNIGLKLPTQREFLELESRVVSCDTKGHIIFTLHLEFVNLDVDKKNAIKEFVRLFLKG